MPNTFAVMGNAVVDGIAHVDDEQLALHGLTKGDTNILKTGDFLQLSAAVAVEAFHSGGAGANMAYTLAKLGQSVRFLARVGSEPAGEHFFADMVAAGLTMLPPQPDVRTLEVLVLVTPDGTRTMVQPQPVAASEDDFWVEDALLDNCQWQVLEGYAAAAHPAAARYMWQHAAKAGKSQPTRVLLLPAPHACTKHAALFAKLIAEHQPMVIGNHKEYEALLAAKPDAAKSLKTLPHVITSSAGAARFINGTTKAEAKPVPVDVPTDSTGAGDAFAAGFLLEYASSGDAESAIKRGHQLAYAVLHQFGPRLDDPAMVWAEPLRS